MRGRSNRRSPDEQAWHIEDLSKQLAQAAMIARRPDLTLGEAQASGQRNLLT